MVTLLDVLGLVILLSDEANKEIAEYLQSPISMIHASGQLSYPLEASLTKYQFYAATYHPLD